MGYRIEHWNEVSHIIEDGPTPEGRLFCSFIGDDHIQKSDRVIGLLRGQPAQPAGPTVRCRIAVCVTTEGQWHSYGDSELTTKESLLQHVNDCIAVAGDRISIIEADVPQPVEPAVIEGMVVE